MESWDNKAEFMGSDLGEFSEGLGFDFSSILANTTNQLSSQLQTSIVKSGSELINKTLGVQQPPVYNPPQTAVQYYQAPANPPIYQSIPAPSAPLLDAKTKKILLIGGGSLVGIIFLGIMFKMVRG
jgi:hypothetical protein